MNASGCSAVSPPISAQPASSQPRAMPLITSRATRDVEPLADVIVEEEQRLGALHENVVDAHRDEVDADRVVAIQCERELELGADAVGARDEHRLAIARRHRHQRAEAADAGQHLRAHRAPGEQLDGLDAGDRRHRYRRRNRDTTSLWESARRTASLRVGAGTGKVSRS